MGRLFGGFKSIEEKRAYQRKYYQQRKASDPAYLNAEGARWRKNNTDKAKEASKKYLYGKGYDDHKLRTRTRRHKTTQQKISKYFKEEIQAIYKNCPDGYQVDHIEPISRSDSCGLHVPWNLQYLTREENTRKGNKRCL